MTAGESTEPPSALARPADVYTPFDQGEVRRLRRFVDRVDALGASAFIAHPGYRMKGTLVAAGVLENLRVDSPGEEAVRAVLPLFRELYTDSNPTSAMSALRVLDRRARTRGAPDSLAARNEIRTWRRSLRDRRDHDPYGVLLEEDRLGCSVERAPSYIIDLWFNGEYFHFDDEKAGELGDNEPVTEMMRMSLHSAIRDFTRTWTAIGRFTTVALQEPTLRPG